MQKLMHEMENWRQSMIKAAGYTPESIQLRNGEGFYAPPQELPYDTDLPVGPPVDVPTTPAPAVGEADSYLPDPNPPAALETDPVPVSSPGSAGTPDLSLVGNPAETAQIMGPTSGPNKPPVVSRPIPKTSIPAIPLPNTRKYPIPAGAGLMNDGEVAEFGLPEGGRYRRKVIMGEGGRGAGYEIYDDDTGEMVRHLTPEDALSAQNDRIEKANHPAEEAAEAEKVAPAAPNVPVAPVPPIKNKAMWSGVGAGIGAGAGTLLGGALGYGLGGKDRKLSSTLLGAGLGLGGGALLGGLGGAYYGNRQS